MIPYVFELFSVTMLALSLSSVIVRLMKKTKNKPLSLLSFPLAKILMLLMSLIFSILIAALHLGVVALTVFLLLQSFLLLLYRYEFIRHLPYLISMSILCFVSYLLLALLGTPLSMMLLAFVFVPVSSILEYVLLSWYMRRFFTEITLLQLMVFSETQVFKFCSAYLCFFSLQAWYLGWERASAVCVILYAAYCSFLIWNCYSGRRFVLSPVSVRRLTSAFSQRYGASSDEEIEWEKGQLGIYHRLNYYFEKEKPFLNPDLSLAEVAQMLYTNKVYLGKAIKNCGHTNFKRFINRYRVKYAMEIFVKKPALKINQLCLMSGFKTKATFNSAFLLENGESPKEWCDYIRTKK